MTAEAELEQNNDLLSKVNIQKAYGVVRLYSHKAGKGQIQRNQFKEACEQRTERLDGWNRRS